MLRILERLRRDDAGAALASVMALVLVGVLITTLVMSSVISALGNTTATRASVQSQAAAQAGIAAAFAGILTAGSCAANGAIYTSNANPKFRATVWYGTSIGCPTGSGTVKIISTGWAQSKGVAGNQFGDVSYLEATYTIASNNASGSAVYINGSGNVSAFTVTLADATTPGNVQLPSGNFQCNTAGSVINGDIVVAAGTVYLNSSCTVNGSIRASGAVKLDSGSKVTGDVISSGGAVEIQNSSVQVGGSVYANGNVVLHGQVAGSIEATGTVNMNSGSSVGGNVAAGGDVTINGTVTGNVTSPGGGTMSQSGGWIKGNLTLGGTLARIETGSKVDRNVSAAGTGQLTLTPSYHIGGTLAIGGDLDTWGYSGANDNANKAAYLRSSGHVVGAITFRQSGLPVPSAPVAKPAPVVPSWVNWSYDKSKFVAAGFSPTEVVWPASKCEMDNTSVTTTTDVLYPIWQKIINSTTPIIINGLACGSNGIALGNSAMTRVNPLNVRTDIAFIAKKITLGQAVFASGDAAPHKLYFLVEDGAPTVAGPDCTNGAGNISTYGTSPSTKVTAPLSAIFYTPCKIDINNGTVIRGQFYSKEIQVGDTGSLVYTPVGIPGTNLDGVTGGASVGSLSNAVSIRNVSGNGE